MFEYIAGTVFIVYAIYWWLSKDHDYWKKRGVPFVPPRILVGNMGEMVTMKKSFGQVLDDLYNEHKDRAFIGLFNVTTPAILINDLNIIRNVLVKEFNKFHENSIEVSEDVEPIISKATFFLTGDKWKLVRSQLAPFLTTLKIKSMFPLIQQNCINMINFVDKELKLNKDGIDAKAVAKRFTTDNVVSCVFGVDGHSFDYAETEFSQMNDAFLKPNFWRALNLMIISVFPGLTKILDIKFGEKDASYRYKKMVLKIVKDRKENNIVKDDYMNSLIELQSKPTTSMEFTDDYLVASTVTFFLDGIETSAVVLAFALYELAANPDIQNKFLKEIKEASDKCGGSITFDAMHEMNYLDAIFLETLRKYPAVTAMTRKCTEETTFPTASGKDFKVEKDTSIYISIYGLHRDARYYPDPERFDPDRFTNNAKHPLPKNCYFAFGGGPRGCTGQKFSNMHIKAGLIAIVSNFEISVNNKTKLPFEMHPQAMVMCVKGGVWLNFCRRST